MAMFHEKNPPKISGTERIEAFSDGVFAILITLLILEVKVPPLEGESLRAVFLALVSIGPKLFSFAFSFFSLFIFWVNHHHFFYRLKHADWPLLWHNGSLLFFLTLLPFATAFMGEDPTIPGVIALYALVMSMSALCFRLMVRHALFHSDLVGPEITYDQRCKQYKRSLFGAVVYAAAIVLPFISIWLAWAALLVVPLYYFVPRVLSTEEVE